MTRPGSIARDLADRAELPIVNFTGGEHTRGEFAFQYQVGSLELEPAVLTERLVERGLGTAAVVHDHSPVGRRYATAFEEARAGLGIEVTGTAAVSPLREDLGDVVARLRSGSPDALVYLGLGVTSRPLAVALAEAAWTVPVVANSALMFGYARPEWRAGWRGWEYLDSVADDNDERRALRDRAPEVAAGPLGCAAYDAGRLLGEALVRTEHLTRAGLKEGLERVKRLLATSGYPGTTMGFGHYDHGALEGRYLVLREWRDGRSVQVGSAAGGA